MTKEEFLNTMEKWNVASSLYSINGEEKDDSLIINKEKDSCYSIYYFERGQKEELEKVSTIEEAYDFIVQTIKHWIDTGSSVSPVSEEFIANYDKITEQWLKERNLSEF